MADYFYALNQFKPQSAIDTMKRSFSDMTELENALLQSQMLKMQRDAMPSQMKSEQESRQMQKQQQQLLLEKMMMESEFFPEQQRMGIERHEMDLSNQALQQELARQDLMMRNRYGAPKAEMDLANSELQYMTNQGALSAMLRQQQNQQKMIDMGLITPESQEIYGKVMGAQQAQQALDAINKGTNNFQTQENLPPMNGQSVRFDSMPDLGTSGKPEEGVVKKIKSPFDYLISKKNSTGNLASYAQDVAESALMTPEKRKTNQEIQSETGKLDAKNWDLLQKESAKEATASNKIMQKTDLLLDSYSKLKKTEKGFVFGHAPSWSTPAQLVDNMTKALVIEHIPLMGGGVISDADLARLESIMLNRKMNDETMALLSNFTSKAKQRDAIKPEFLKMAKKDGMSSYDASAQWIKYLSENSILDEIEYDKTRARELMSKRGE